MKIINITKQSRIPLIGHIAFGIIDRGTSLLQIRPTTLCNLNCQFCSTDSGTKSKSHITQYIVDSNYLIEETKKIIKEKTHINIDSVGEPLTHPEITKIIKELNTPNTYFISMQSNGTLLTKELIKQLEQAGLNRINLSIHTLEESQAKQLSNTPSYNIKKIKEILKEISKSKIELLLAPVLIPKTNEDQIEKLILLAKELNAKIAIQKYERHKYGRKIKGIKEQSYYHFYKKLKELEKKHNIKLIYNPKDLEIQPSKRIEKPIEIGEKINTIILEEGWFKDQKITSHKNRTVTITNCQKNKGDKINIKITQNKNNIYIAEPL